MNKLLKVAFKFWLKASFLVGIKAINKSNTFFFKLFDQPKPKSQIKKPFTKYIQYVTDNHVSYSLTRNQIFLDIYRKNIRLYF